MLSVKTDGHELYVFLQKSSIGDQADIEHMVKLVAQTPNRNKYKGFKATQFNTREVPVR